MAPIMVPDSVKNSLIGLLETGGFFDKMVTMIQQNGELFGAYRAVGQGGIADRVMRTLAGNTHFQENQSEEQNGRRPCRSRQQRRAHRGVHWRQPVLSGDGQGPIFTVRRRPMVRKCPLLYGTELRFQVLDGKDSQPVGEAP